MSLSQISCLTNGLHIFDQVDPKKSQMGGAQENVQCNRRLEGGDIPRDFRSLNASKDTTNFPPRGKGNTSKTRHPLLLCMYVEQRERRLSFRNFCKKKSSRKNTHKMYFLKELCRQFLSKDCNVQLLRTIYSLY